MPVNIRTSIVRGSGITHTSSVGKGGIEFIKDTDPFFNSVVFLSKLDGIDAATEAIDESLTGHAITFAGTAQLDTAQRVFGPSSLLCDGNSDYIFAADSTDFEFGSGAFTLEAWFRPSSVTGTQTVLAKFNSGGDQRSWSIFILNNTTVEFWYSINGQTGDGNRFRIDGLKTLVIGTWYAIAIVRSGNDLHVFVDGELLITGDVTGHTIHPGTGRLSLGAHTTEGTPGSFLNGHVDEVRITKGVARYTADYTPIKSLGFPNR